jgi:hypothetical protein
MTSTAPKSDPWTTLIPVTSFGFSQARTTPEALFDRHDPTGTVERSFDRAERMAQWLRSQENGPWMWIDGQMRQIGLARLAVARETRGTRAHDAAGDRRTTAILAFEAEIEARIRRHLESSSKQRENAAAASAAASIDVIPQAERIQDFATPAFSAREFVAKVEARGVKFTLAGEVGSGFSFTAGDRLLASEMAVVQDYRFEIERYLREVAEVLGE